METVIEYRMDGKLCDAYFCEGLKYVEDTIYYLYDSGATEFVVVANPNNFDFDFLCGLN